MNEKVEEARLEFEQRAAVELDAAMAAQGQGQGQIPSLYPSAVSTPGPSGLQRKVGFASYTPIPKRVVVLADDEDVDMDDQGDEEPEVSLQEQQVAAATAILTGVSVSAANKRDKQPTPLAFWTNRLPEPPSMGQIGGTKQFHR
jgi:hypothetical protein